MEYPQDHSDQVPLARFEVFRTSSCDEVVDKVGRVEPLRAGLPGARGGGSRKLDWDAIEDFYLLYTDLGDETETKVLGKSFCVTAETAALYSPTQAAQVTLGDHAKHLHLKIDRKALESHVETLTGTPIRGPLVFEPRVSLSTDGGALLRDLIRICVRHLDRSDDLVHSPLVVANLEDAILTSLLSSQSHNFSMRFESEPAAPAPRQVKLVEDYIHATTSEPITMKDFVAISNVSARSIHHAFRKYRGYSPKALLMSVRMARARERLLTADAGESVTGIALDCGFAHLGRFSLEYRKRFGESPSSTLRRRQSTRVD
jgi:AraC-like DNA-binding protein